MKKIKFVILIKKLLIAFAILLSVNSSAEEEKYTQANEYTINYDNVSILEYLQFISKICNMNFIYNKDDLNFNVTVLSKEPISKQSLISTLVQMLHIHDLNLIEDNNNIIITKNTDVKELAPIVPPEAENLQNPIITTIFPIKNASIEAISTVIKPMISKNALLEILPNERQLVITDVSANIKKIAELIESLDATVNPLTIETYTIKANTSESLISLTKQIIMPLIAGNPFIMVPQDSTRSIFIVSTPALAKKTLAILQSLDTPAQAEIKTPENLQIFIYKPVNRSKIEIQHSLEELSKNLEKEGYNANIVDAINQMNWMEDAHSFVFYAPKATIAQLQQILQGLDTPKEPKELEEKKSISYELVKLNNVPGDLIEEDMESLANQFKEQKIEVPNLLNVMENIKWVKETNSILLSGDKEAIEEVKNFIQLYDNPQQLKKSKMKPSFFIYKPKNIPINQIEEYLNETADSLKNSGLTDTELLDTIKNMKVVPTTDSIVFTGNEETLAKIKDILNKFDIAKEGQIKGKFLMYSPVQVSLEDLEDSIKEVANNLKSSGLADPLFLDSIKSMKVSSSTHSLIFTGDHDTLEKIRSLLNEIDNITPKQPIQKIGKVNIWIYKIQHASAQQLITALKSTATDLEKLESSDKDFLKALENVRYIKETNSLVFTGTKEALEKIEPYVKGLDTPGVEGTAMQTDYLVYKPQYIPGPQLIQILQHFAENIKTSNLEKQPLFQVIESAKWSEDTKTLVLTGEVSSLHEVEGLLKKFDVPNNNFPTTQEISGLEDLGFLVYKIQYHKGNEIQDALKQIATDLKSTEGEAANKFRLIKSIESIQWIQVTNSLLCSGDKDTLLKIKELISSLDVPLKQVFIEVLVIQTNLNNALQFGLEWGTKFQYKNKAIMGMSNAAPTSSGTNDAFITSMNTISNTSTPNGSSLAFSNSNGFDLGIIGDILFHKGKSFLSLGSLLAALQNDSETSIIMTPKIIAQDGKTAKIFSGQNIPYSGSVITNTSANTTSTTNLEYRDVGLDLTITPILGNSDSVTLTISLDSSSTASTQQGQVQLGQVTGITTFKTTMSTSVHIANKNFLVLSGMVRDEKIKAKTGIPCLGGLPLIGAAFSRDNKQSIKDNIVIFIRPHIINSYEDMQHLTQTQEDYFREQQPTSNLEKDYDEGTDSIKSYEDE